MCRANWQSQRVRYFLRPTKLRWSRKENLAGKAPGPRGWIYSQTRSTGLIGQLPCILDQQRPPRILRDHVQSASALFALKKSLVANLSAKRQLSVVKLSAKRNVSLAKRDFLVANGRMAADFSSPGLYWVRLTESRRARLYRNAIMHNWLGAYAICGGLTLISELKLLESYVFLLLLSETQNTIFSAPVPSSQSVYLLDHFHTHFASTDDAGIVLKNGGAVRGTRAP